MREEVHLSLATLNQIDRVGWLFVQEYYTCLNKTPESLHRFYMKDSTFVHGVEGESADPHIGQKQIHEKIVELVFVDCKVLVSNVDTQPSLHGGIMIQVLGEMRNADKEAFKFAQSFFLAKQAKGYYVLNDIFRYLKEEVNAAYEQDKKAVNGISHEQKSPATHHQAAEKQIAPEKELSIDHTPATTHTETILEKTKPVSPQKSAHHSQPATQKQAPKKTPEPKQEPTPEREDVAIIQPIKALSPIIVEKVEPDAKPQKKSWANLVNMNAAKPITKAIPHTQPSTPIQKKLELLKFDPLKRSEHSSEEREKYSVFVGDVPQNTSSSELAEAFSAFGLITCIELLSQKGIAFIEFASIEICRKAIGNQIILHGKKLVMEERSKRSKKNRRDGDKRDGDKNHSNDRKESDKKEGGRRK